MCQTLCWALEIQANRVRSLPPGQPPGVLRASLASQGSPGQQDHGTPLQQVSVVAGAGKCRATGFPKVKLDVREQSQPSSNRHQRREPGAKGGGGCKRPGVQDSAAVAGLGARRSHTALSSTAVWRCGDNDDLGASPGVSQGTV